MKKSVFLLVFVLLYLETPGSSQQASPDWLTWGGDQQRTMWAKAETTLSKDNVSRLELKWKAQLDTPPSVMNYYATLTDPLVVDGVTTRQGTKTLVFVAGAKNTIYAIDADSGKVFWQKTFPNDLKPVMPPSTACPNDLNATPVIDKEKGIIYALATDGKIRGLSLADGEDRFPATDFSPPYARTWSLNLIDGVIYAPIGRGCGAAMANFAALDVTGPNRPAAVHYYTSTGRPAGAWGRGGMIRGPRGVYAQTADGPYDPAAGRFGNSVLLLSKDLRLLDSFTPANWKYLNQKDLDLGSGSPVLFPFQKWQLLAVAGKEGLIYLLDAGNLGGADHQTPLFTSPRYANDAVTMMFTAMWGAMSSYEDAQGQRWLLVPLQGPAAKATLPQFQHTNGTVENGSVTAFQVKVENEKPVLAPVWISRDLELPGVPVAVNGMVFAVSTGERGRYVAAVRQARGGGDGPGPAGSGGRAGARGGRGRGNAPGMDTYGDWNASQSGPDGQRNNQDYTKKTDFSHGTLYALDAATGKELYSSGDLLDSWNHNGGLAVAKGRIYVSTWDARVYSFGLK